MNKNLLFSAIAIALTFTTICALAQDKPSASSQDASKPFTTTAGVPMVQLSNGMLMPQFGLDTYDQDSNEIRKPSCLWLCNSRY